MIPVSTSRLLIGGRPPFLLMVRGGRRGSISSHTSVGMMLKAMLLSCLYARFQAGLRHSVATAAPTIPVIVGHKSSA